MSGIIKVLYWLPRIICILAIIFISIFAADAFEPGKSMGQQLIAFLIHLIPSFVLLLLLLLAWKKELIGGIIFTVIGIVMTPVIFLHNYNVNHFLVAQCIGIVLMITFPFILCGILFFTNYFIKRKQSV
jgi:hypothetical protein